MSLMKYYLMLQNARVTAFTISDLLRENQKGRGKMNPPSLTLGLRTIFVVYSFTVFRVQKYCFLAYIWTITDKSWFFSVCSNKNSLSFMKKSIPWFRLLLNFLDKSK